MEMTIFFLGGCAFQAAIVAFMLWRRIGPVTAGQQALTSVLFLIVVGVLSFVWRMWG